MLINFTLLFNGVLALKQIDCVLMCPLCLAVAYRVGRRGSDVPLGKWYHRVGLVEGITVVCVLGGWVPRGVRGGARSPAIG